MSKKVSSKEEIAHVGAISANNDRVIGDLLADAMEKVGKDGVITVEEGKTTETTLELVEGMQFDKGYLSPYFINQPATMECVLEDAYILIHEKKISNLRELLPILEQVSQKGKPLLIIAEDVEGEALAALVVNKLRGVLNVCAVKAPGFGDRRKAMLGDIATLTGGTVISEDLGMKLENLTLDRARPGEEDHRQQGQHDDRPRRRQAAKTSRSGSSRFARRSKARPAITTTRSCRSGWRSSPAAWRSSRSARERSRHEAEEGPRRRRPARHPCGGRRRHSARRRRGPAALPRSGRRGPLAAPRATRRSASTSSSACSQPR